MNGKCRARSIACLVAIATVATPAAAYAQQRDTPGATEITAYVIMTPNRPRDLRDMGAVASAGGQRD